MVSVRLNRAILTIIDGTADATDAPQGGVVLHIKPERYRVGLSEMIQVVIVAVPDLYDLGMIRGRWQKIQDSKALQATIRSTLVLADG